MESRLPSLIFFPLPTYLIILPTSNIFFLKDSVVYRYGEWSKYSSCTKSCGNGVRVRTRECFGDVCMGPATQTKPCNNLSACPSKWLFSINFMRMKILKGSLDLISSPSPSGKIQIMGGKVCLRRKGKTLLGIVNTLLKTKNVLTSPCNVLPFYLR